MDTNGPLLLAWLGSLLFLPFLVRLSFGLFITTFSLGLMSFVVLAMHFLSK